MPTILMLFIPLLLWCPPGIAKKSVPVVELTPVSYVVPVSQPGSIESPAIDTGKPAEAGFKEWFLKGWDRLFGDAAVPAKDSTPQRPESPLSVLMPLRFS